MKDRLINILKFLGFLSLGIVILGLVYRSQNAAFEAQCKLDGVAPADCSLIDKLTSDLSTIDPKWLIAGVAIFMLSNIFRAWRWQQLTDPLGKKISLSTSFWAIMIGYFANLGIPRMGEVVRAGVVSRYEGISTEKVMGTVVVDRILDLICLLIFMGLALVVQWDTLSSFILEANKERQFSFSIQSILLYGTLLFAVLAAGVWGVYRLFKNNSDNAIVKKVTDLVSGFIDGLKSLSKVKNKPLLVLNTIGIWGCYYFMAYIPFLSFPPTSHLGLDAGLMVFVFSAIGIVVPSPGGLGSYHLMVIQALELFGINGNDAFSYANILFFSVQIGANILFGILGLIVLPLINQGKSKNRLTDK